MNLWSRSEQAPRPKVQERRTFDDLWVTCLGCGRGLRQVALKKNWGVCDLCGHHHKLSVEERILLLLDPHSWEEEEGHLRSHDPLGFVDSVSYKERLMRSEAQWGRPEGMVMGIGTLENIRIRLCVAEFGFMGGSMGCVMGEKIAQTLIRASREDCGVLIVSASGGARMQEGLLSLMQMAKVMAALAEFRKGVRPFVSLLTNPTTGGVAASYALLGDIHIAEPGALIGFAGPRVIKDTLGVRLPEGFQKAETLLRLGMIDRIEPRAGQRAFLAKIFKMLGMKRGMDAP